MPDKKISIMPGDTIILSSNPIPGNEKAVSNIINELFPFRYPTNCDTLIFGGMLTNIWI